MTETYRLRIFYEKTGPAVFISGRNLLKIMERTFRRIEAPLKFTEGFSPHPRISFGHPLPLNVSGTNESFDVFLCKKTEPDEIIRKTREILPEGILFRFAHLVEMSEPSIGGRETFAEYVFETAGKIDRDALGKAGKILEDDNDRIRVLIKINNFSHKNLAGLLLDGTVKSISRKIMDNTAPPTSFSPQEGRDVRGTRKVSDEKLQTVD